MSVDKPSYEELLKKISALEFELESHQQDFENLLSHFNEIQSLAKIGHWELDVERNELYWSDEIYKMFECNPLNFEATYEAFLGFVHPSDRDLVNQAYLNHLHHKQPYDIIHRIVTTNGTVKYVNERCKSNFHPNGNPLRSIGTVADITERIQNEINLEKAMELATESEMFMRALVNTIPDLIWMKNPSGVYLQCNQRFQEFFGATEDEILGKTDYDFTSKEMADFFRDNDTKAMLAGKPTINEELITFANDGHQEYLETIKTPLLNQEGEILGILGIGRDITFRKQAEAELIKAKEAAESSREQLQTILDNAIFPISLVTTGGRPIYLNNALKKYLEIEEEDLTKFNSERVWLNPERREIFLKSLVHNRMQTNFENDYLTLKTKKKITALVSASIIKYNTEDCVFAIFQDITDRKNLELQLIEAKEKAEESDRLKTAFLNNISHEIRTPLNAICGFSHLISNGKIAPEKSEYFSKIIQNSSNQLLTIVNNIITVSSLQTKQEKLIITEFNLNELLDDLYAQFNMRRVNSNLQFHLEKDAAFNPPVIKTDKGMLYQILTNLLTNAFKFTHEGSIQFGYRIKDNYIEFQVNDTGIGIAPNINNHIFELFRQAEIGPTRNYGGTGLGLSISKGLVELLNGKIWFESAHGVGSTFYFTLPYNYTKNQQIESPQMKYKKGEGIILIAEDEDFNFELITEYLSHFKFKILRARDGIEAIEICENNKEISLILMDIKMPRLDGYEAAKQIKAKFPGMYIFAQTAYAMKHEREKYGNIFDAYITKPIQANQLTETISDFFHIQN